MRFMMPGILNDEEIAVELREVERNGLTVMIAVPELDPTWGDGVRRFGWSKAAVWARLKGHQVLAGCTAKEMVEGKEED